MCYISIIKDKSILILDTHAKHSKTLERFLIFHKAKEVNVIDEHNSILAFLEEGEIEKYDYVFVDIKLETHKKNMLKYLKSKIPQKKNSFVAIIDSLNSFNLEQLKKHGSGLFISRPIKPTEILHTFEEISNQLKQENLLVVDDEIEILNLMREIFSDMNLNIYLAHDAEEAIHILNNNKIKGIVSDFNLPGKNGLEFYQKVHNDFGEIPFIILSAFLTSDIRKSAHDLHIKQLIDKPFDIEYLKGAVEKMMTQPKKVQESSLLPINRNENFYKILIADDSEDNRRLMEIYLKDLECNLIFVDNGKDAVHKVLNNHDIDLVFMDIQMPIMNGIDATLEIRNYEKENNLKHIPIIALTANVLNEQNNTHFTRYLTKPIKKETVINCIDGVTKKVA